MEGIGYSESCLAEASLDFFVLKMQSGVKCCSGVISRSEMKLQLLE
jgi:hypothetical protein